MTSYKSIGLLIGACVLGSYSLILVVLSVNTVSNVLALRETSIIMAALISTLYLKETISKKQWWGIIFICLGAIGIKCG